MSVAGYAPAALVGCCGAHPPEPANGSPGATGLVRAFVGSIRQARWRPKSGREQLGQRHRDVGGVADVAVAVGVGQPRGLEVVMEDLDLALGAEIEVGQDVERLPDRRAAARRRGHPVDVVAPVVDVGGVAERGPVGLQVVEGHRAGPRGERRPRRKGEIVHGPDDVAADRSAVQSADPVATDQRVGPGEIRVAHDRADGRQLPTREKHRAGGAELVESEGVLAVLLDQRRIEREATRGHLLGRPQVIGQPESAPPLEGALPGHQRAGHADREAARHRRRERERLARRGVDEQARGIRRRRGLPAVDRVDPVGAGVVVDEVASAADPGDERVGYAEGRGHGDRGVRRRAASRQDAQPGPGSRHGVGCHSAAAPGCHRLL